MNRPERRAAAMAQLGVSEADILAMPHISDELSRIHGAVRRTNKRAGLTLPADPIYWLNTSDDPDARKFLASYLTLPRELRRACPIEAVCKACEISPIRVLQLVTFACVQMNAQAASVIATASQPAVVQRAVEFAMQADGHQDRMLLSRATGFLPLPKSAQTNITVTQNARVESRVAAAPIPEQTIRRAIDRFNDAAGLPPLTMAALPPAAADPIVGPPPSADPAYSIEPEQDDGA